MAQAMILLSEGELPVKFSYYDNVIGVGCEITITFNELVEAWANHNEIMQQAAEALIPAINASKNINNPGGDYQLVSITKLLMNEDVPLI